MPATTVSTAAAPVMKPPVAGGFFAAFICRISAFTCALGSSPKTDAYVTYAKFVTGGLFGYQKVPSEAHELTIHVLLPRLRRPETKAGQSAKPVDVAITSAFCWL